MQIRTDKNDGNIDIISEVYILREKQGGGA